MREPILPYHRLTLKTMALALFLSFAVVTWMPVNAQRKHRTHKTTKINKTKSKDRGQNFDEAKTNTLIDSIISHSSFNDRQADAVASIRNYYSSLNNTGKQKLLEALSDKTAQLLDQSKKDESLALTCLYAFIASEKDEKLPTMLYIKGTIYAEKLDTIHLKETISQLEKCQSAQQANEYLTTLRKNLVNVRNYVPPLQKMNGSIWVSSDISMYGIPDISNEIIPAPSLMFRSYYSNFDNGYFIIEKDASPLIKKIEFEQGNLKTQRLYAISADSIYAAWGTKELKGDMAIMFAPVLRDITTGAAANINAEYSQRNEHSFGTELAVKALTSLGEILVNSIIDAIFTPSAKVYCFETFLKYENDYTLTGTLKCQYAQVSADGHVESTRTAEKPITFSRWEPESGVVFEKMNGKEFKLSPTSTGKGAVNELSHNNEDVYEASISFINKIKPLYENTIKQRGVDYYSHEDSIRTLIHLYDGLLTTDDYKRYDLFIREYVLPPFQVKYGNVTKKIAKKLNLSNTNGVHINSFNINFFDNDYLIKNDVVIAVNNKEINDVDDFESLVSSLKIGDLMNCRVIRNKQQIDVPIWVTWNKFVVGENNEKKHDKIKDKESKMESTDVPRHAFWKKNGTKKKREAWNDDQYKWLVLYNDSVLTSQGIKSHILDNVTPDVGLKVVDIPDKVKKKVKLENGAYVEHVELIGAANVAGIKKKDIILSINGMNIALAEDFDYMVKNSRPGDWLYCGVLRGNKQIEIPIRVTWK